MIAEPEGTPVHEQEAVVTKPRARRKKVAEPEATPEIIVAAEQEKAKPAKKTTRKVKAEVIETAAEVVAVEVVAPLARRVKKTRTAEPATATVAAAIEVPEPEVVAEVTAAPERSVEKKAKKAKKVAAAAPDLEQADASGPVPKLERLQKILAKAGISSRRKAEELILGGQVQINGKVVTELGTKADPARDHVRVDGKLLQGPERIRYFVLNKPKGFVTTVSDPEGRPTVMQFFLAERERLYPVGRLDYLSEGLLLVTNDGELANKLTKAASGVEKTYLVKVAGQPTEDMLDMLRAGVVIEKGRPGNNEGRVRTAPAKIRQVREGDNPWYEVIIIEGRNRELRKMFEEIGHHVEKIRRIGYGPLVLDLEPGKLRELEAEEVQQLRLAAEGKLKLRRRRGPKEAQLPTVAGKTVRYKKADGKPGYEPRTKPDSRSEFKPAARPFVKPATRPEFQLESPAEPRAEFKRIPKSEFHDGDKPAFKAAFKSDFKSDRKPEFRSQGKADFKGDYKPRPKPAFRSDSRPASQPDSRPAFRPDTRPESRPSPRPASGARFGASSGPISAPRRDFAGRDSFGRGAAPGRAPARASRPEPPVTDYVLPPRKPRPELDDDATPQKGAFNPDYKPGFRAGDKPAAPGGPRPGGSSGRPLDGPPKRFGAGKPFRPVAASRPMDDDDWVPTKTPGFKIEPVEEKPRSERPRSSGPGSFDRSGRDSGPARPFRPRPEGSRSEGSRSEGARPQGGRAGGFAGGGKPFRSTGARPPAGDRPFRPREDGPASQGRGARTGPPAGEGSTFGRNAGRPASGFKSFGDRPRPSGPRSSGPSASSGPSGAGARPFRPAGDDRPRESRPESRPGAPKNFASSRPSAAGPRKSGPAKSGPAKSGPPRTGPDGEPRIKERWRNSFTGKNKGRPKPKP